ncbi:single-stranded DNA-binding protein [Candidatus Uhrbacteria bacterium]|nr:single-stranded DNA-binding protein [Candidatus Uhrbacteria bacterium]
MNLNKATIIGRLTRDPDLKELPTGGKLATYGVATNRQWVDQKTNDKKENVEFHQVLAWGKLAELSAKFLKKGRQVYVEGHLQTRAWTDKESQKHSKTEIVAEQVIFLDKNSKMLNPQEPIKAEEIALEEVPFAA